MSDVAHHLHALADQIGARPATTDAEAKAADYIEGVFREREQLEVERQEFTCPRTYGWAYILYHVGTIAAAGASNWSLLVWPAFALSALVAFFMWMDLDTRTGLTSLMPKGPSQNVIAKYVPRSRRGERARRIVIVSHYDSARSSLAFAPGMVKNFWLTFGLMKTVTGVVPVLVFVNALPFTTVLDPWLWYATLGVSAYLLIPLLINLHRELFMDFVDGANDNASGVAAMLGILETLLPTTQEGAVTGLTGSFTMPFETVQPSSSWDDVVAGHAAEESVPVRHTPEEALAAEVVPEGAELMYAPTPTPAPVSPVSGLPADFRWAEPIREEADADASMLFATSELDVIAPDTPRMRFDDEEELDEAPPVEPAPPAASTPKEPPAKPKRFAGAAAHGIRGWLGLSDDFEVRSAGQTIGSWENFDAPDEDEDGDDGFGSKGGDAGEDGSASDDSTSEAPLSAVEAFGDVALAYTPPSMEMPEDDTAERLARIRRKVADGVDRELADKEIWFVATGAEESGTWGMRAFLDAYGPELRDAMIINIDNVGSGKLFWVTEEGMARRYSANQRLTSLARRIARERQLPITGHAYKGLSTDATPALARRMRAMSVMAFDINGRLPDWHWHTDTVENVDVALVESAADFVSEMIREA